MPPEKSSANVELDEYAFEIFKASVAAANRGGERQAIAAYQKAEAFIAVREKVRGGLLATVKPTGPQLADCSAPNLPKTHPHNLVSRRFGNLERVQQIHKWLTQNPSPEKEPEELIPRINRQFPEINWDVATINTARAIFPAYASN